jgi:signal transduction histidine kinase
MMFAFTPLSRPRTRLVARVCVFAVSLGSVLATGYLPGSGKPWIPVYLACVVCVCGAVAYSLPHRRRRVFVAGLAASAIASGVVAVLGPDTAAVAMYCEVAFTAGFELPVWESGVLAGAGLVTTAATNLLEGRGWSHAFGLCSAFVGLWLSGASRRQYRQRAEQAELLLAETRRAAEADRRAAALAERARIAREIHDIQAHSLSALSLQLEAAGALLQDPSLPAGDAVLAKVAGCVHRASGLAREGLAETSRAVQALREDFVSLPEVVKSLVDIHVRGEAEPVTVQVRGTPRPLPPGPGLTLYRVVQEGLTNALKHAPHAPVQVELDYTGDAVTATITNGEPRDGPSRPLSATGAGYGLTGIRERAELAGGSLTAGPAAGGWRVSVRIPS